MSRLSLAPRSGFCVKSSLLRALSEPFALPAGCKVFVNVAWDALVPPPPPADEHGIQLAMSANGSWFVPVIVSALRQDLDKAGKQALVVDAVYNTSLKKRSQIDPSFKTFLIQLAFQRIEAQHSIALSADISVPNIPSKGALAPRSVLIPTQPTHGDSLTPGLTPAPAIGLQIPPIDAPTLPEKSPSWSWSKSTFSIAISIAVPDLINRSIIQSSTLDVEPRRLILHIPSLYSLDLNLDLPDKDFALGDDAQVQQALSLKRTRDFDVIKEKSSDRLHCNTSNVYSMAQPPALPNNAYPLP